MKNNIRNKIKRILDGFNKILKEINKKENENIALQLLDSLKPANTYIPATAFSLTPSLIVHILNDITINKRKSIIEFGTGFSTFYIANLIKKNNLNINFYSVDSSSDWIEIVKKNLKEEHLLEYVNLIYSPLVSSSFKFKEHKKWYDTKVLDTHLAKETFDMVIVDGPGGSVKYSRYGAIPYLSSNKLDESYFIVLDDTDRKEEKEIIESWENELRGDLSTFRDYSILCKEIKFDSKPLFLRI